MGVAFTFSDRIPLPKCNTISLHTRIHIRNLPNRIQIRIMISSRQASKTLKDTVFCCLKIRITTSRLHFIKKWINSKIYTMAIDSVVGRLGGNCRTTRWKLTSTKNEMTIVISIQEHDYTICGINTRRNHPARVQSYKPSP